MTTVYNALKSMEHMSFVRNFLLYKLNENKYDLNKIDCGRFKEAKKMYQEKILPKL